LTRTGAGTPLPMNLHDLLRRAESLPAADKPAGLLARVSGKVVPGKRFAEFLRGAWLGHPVHPILVTVPIGAWLSTGVLDLTGRRAAARQVVAFGLATVPAAVLAGLADYADLNAAQRRTGVVHAAANTVATALAVASFACRSRNRHAAGAVLNALGLAAAGAGGALGGHLAYAQGAGVRRYDPPFERRP
jgi:uncharacterized membrane protein